MGSPLPLNGFQVKQGAKIQLSMPDLKLFDVSNEVSHSPLIWEARNSGREAISRVKLRLNSRLHNLKAKKLIFAVISLFFIIQTWELVKILYSCIDLTLHCQFLKKSTVCHFFCNGVYWHSPSLKSYFSITMKKS